MTAEALAIAAQGGDRDCFDELVKRLRPRLRAFLVGKSQSPEDADDLTQEAFLKAYAELERYDSNWRFSTWLFTIAARMAVSSHRKKPAEAPLLDHAGATEDASLVLLRQDAGRKLWLDAKKILSERDYHALHLRYAGDHSVVEIAKILGVTQVHTKVILYRARHKLARETEQ